jgi:hypothetical protein
MKEEDNANTALENREEYEKLNNPNTNLEIKSGSNDRYNNISSIADLTHKRILQPDTNEFEILYDIKRFEFFGPCIASLVLFIITILMLVLYEDDEVGDSFFYYLEIAFFVCLFCLQLYAFISCPCKFRIILGEDDITIKSIGILSIFHWTQNFKSGQIKKFDYVETKDKKKDKKKEKENDNKKVEINEIDDKNKEVEISIQIIDDKNSRNNFCIQKFYLEEVEYFISRVNNHIEQKMKVDISN